MVAEHAAVCVDTVTRQKRLTPPDGHARWSLRLLEKHVRLTEGLPPLDHSTIGRDLEKRNFDPHLKEWWAFPPTTNGKFVARMEAVLDAYARPCDTIHPVVRMDEQPHQLLDYTRPSIEAKPGRTRKEDYECSRYGVCAILCGSNRWPGSAG